MGKTVALVAVLPLVLSVPRTGQAVTGTCTISSFTSITPNAGLFFDVPVVNGLEMPVEFDEAMGAFSMKRDAWAERFNTPYCSFTTTQSCTVDSDCAPPACPVCNDPSGDMAEVCATGAPFLTVGTIHGFLVMNPGTVTGTIDAGGTVTLPNFEETLLTDYEKPLRPLMNMPTVSTGIRQTTVGTTPYATEGVPLDFTTGDLTLSGADLLFNAPGTGGTNATGFTMRCRLSPIPDPAKLPPAPTLKLRGRIKPGSATKGDTLIFKARLTPGAAGLTLDGSQDFFIRLSAGGQTRVLLLVAATKFTVKGKKLTAVEVSPPDNPASNGTVIRALKGHKMDVGGAAPFGGRITVKPGKKLAKVTARLTGLDLSQLTESGTMTIAVGTQNATAGIAVTAKGASSDFR